MEERCPRGCRFFLALAGTEMLRPQLSAFVDELEKISEKQERSGKQRAINALYGTGLLAASPKAMQMGAHRLLGVQAVHHGTDAASAAAIREKGLDPSFGGSADHGDLYRDRFYRNSKGHAFVTEMPSTARRYAREAGLKTGLPGAVVSGAMPYEEFAPNFIPDTDSSTFFDFKTPKRIDASVFKTTPADVMRSRLKHPGNYAKMLVRYPGRALVGAGLLATPALGAELLRRTGRSKSHGGNNNHG